MDKFKEKDTENYYNIFGDVYEMVWDEQIHTGYFDKENNLEQATKEMDTFLAEQANFKKDCMVVVLGSGRGGADRFLAKKYNAKVIGIDLSEKQILEAEKKSKAENLDIEYIHASMTDIPLKNETADYLWIQEAFFHCHDKYKAANEFARILKKNGVVIIEDTLLMDNNSKNEVLEKFGKRVKINEIITPEQYIKIFNSVGLKVLKQIDLTKHLAITYKKIIEYISKNKEQIMNNTPEEYKKGVALGFGFPTTLKLVEEGKLGCMAFYFGFSVPES